MLNWLIKSFFVYFCPLHNSSTLLFVARSISSAIKSLHYKLISLSPLCESGLVGVVYHQYRTLACAVMDVIFRAGDFKAAQILVPGAKGLNSTVCLPAGVHRGHYKSNQASQIGRGQMIQNSGNERTQPVHSDLKEDSLSVCLSICWTQIRSLLSHHLTHRWLAHYHFLPSYCSSPPSSFLFFCFKCFSPSLFMSKSVDLLLSRQQTNAYKELLNGAHVLTLAVRNLHINTSLRAQRMQTAGYNTRTCQHMTRTQSSITKTVTNIQEPKYIIK